MRWLRSGVTTEVAVGVEAGAVEAARLLVAEVEAVAVVVASRVPAGVVRQVEAVEAVVAAAAVVVLAWLMWMLRLGGHGRGHASLRHGLVWTR